MPPAPRSAVGRALGRTVGRAAGRTVGAALALAGLGYRVREMIGGFEYWAREGLPVATADGLTRPDVDPLTAPRAVSCGC